MRPSRGEGRKLCGGRSMERRRRVVAEVMATFHPGISGRVLVVAAACCCCLNTNIDVYSDDVDSGVSKRRRESVCEGVRETALVLLLTELGWASCHLTFG